MYIYIYVSIYNNNKTKIYTEICIYIYTYIYIYVYEDLLLRIWDGVGPVARRMSIDEFGLHAPVVHT